MPDMTDLQKLADKLDLIAAQLGDTYWANDSASVTQAAALIRHNESISGTEKTAIVSCLAVGWAIAVIAKGLLAHLAALALTLLGWRPGPPLAYVLDCSTGQTRPIWDFALAARLAAADDCATTEERNDLIAAILDAMDDAANDYSGEVPTAAERSPSLLEKMP